MSEELLYIYINLGVISIPLLLSFDKKVAFYKNWKYLFPSILMVGLFFISWDVWFTEKGYWGFNPRYLSSVKVFNLPLAECLFFLTVPYACVFIYASLKAYFGNKLDRFPSGLFLILFTSVGIMLLLWNFGKPYTTTAVLLNGVISIWLLKEKPAYLNGLIVTFVVSVIPFMLVNGLLTGSWIEEEVVWYNSLAFSNLRLFTIPVEDIFYSFDLIALTIIVMEEIKNRKAIALSPR